MPHSRKVPRLVCAPVLIPLQDPMMVVSTWVAKSQVENRTSESYVCSRT
jgi:hypothetical protein